MSTIFDFLYHEYCLARLAEMRKQVLTVSGATLPEADCDVSHPSGSDNGFGDDRTVPQREALHIH